MKKFNLGISLLVIFQTTSFLSYAQSPTAATATGHVFAEVITVFSASEMSQLYFGKFSPGPQGGEIILTPESTVSVIGSVFTGTGIHNAASFYVTGDDDAMFSITLPTVPATLTNVNNAKTMKVSDWVSVPGRGIGTGKLDGGYSMVKVGATLFIGTLNDNPPGIYTGTYSITFDFN